MNRVVALALVTLLGSTGAAAAEVAIARDPSAPPPASRASEHRFDGRAGFMVGGADVGDVNGLSLGFNGQLGDRLDDVTLFGELDYLSVGDSPDDAPSHEGRTTRYGLAARYSLLHTASHDDPVGGDLWVEAGVGYENVAWKEGGVLNRP